MRKISFRHELLDKNNLFIGYVDVERSSVSFDSMANITRTAQFTVHKSISRDIDYLHEYIRPVVVLTEDGNTTETPLGAFMLSSPKEKTSETGAIAEIEAYDRTQVLLEDCVTNRFYLPQGHRYSAAITSIANSAGILDVFIDDNDKVLRRSREWDIGTSKLKIINELLKEMNYNRVYTDKNGLLMCTAYKLPWQKQPEVKYTTDELSQVFPGAVREMDLFNVPNVWVCVASNAEDEPLVAIEENNNPASETSVQRRGRKIVKVESISDIADQEALNAYTKRLAFNGTNIHETLEFETLINPNHGYQTAMLVQHRGLGIDAKYIETAWSIPLQVGGKMRHRARRILQV